MSTYWHIWLSALFLRGETYEYQRDRKNPFGHGLLFIALIGVIVALFGILGAGLRFAGGPNIEAIKNIVLTHLENMPFYDAMGSARQSDFLRGYDQFWNNLGGVLAGYPTNARETVLLLATVVTTPLGWIIGWLLYGGLAHLIARAGKHETNLAAGLGALALATAPQLLKVIEFLPGANVSGLMIAVWTCICNVVALRIAYRISTRRAVSAALFPILLLLIPLALLLCIGLIALIGAGRGGVR